MKIVFFVHSIVSDWNHGNAHFLRGLMESLVAAGHDVVSWEPAGGWSVENLVADAGAEPIVDFAREFPTLRMHSYRTGPQLRETVRDALRGADVVIVHEWNEPEVVGLVGLEAMRAGVPALFHDTHHRALSVPEAIARFPLDRYEGVLAFGDSLRRVYLETYGVRAAWTFHEAADVHRFRPLERPLDSDVVWVGNWGDDERREELRRFWLGAARALPELRFTAHGVRYPRAALREVRMSRVDFRGWIPSLRVPDVLARSRVTLHIPRSIYQERLPGIPTIRVFEALACGIPLISTPWKDTEGLFGSGDMRIARTPAEMIESIRYLVGNPGAAMEQAERGLERIRARHTCGHRANQLLHILDGLGREGGGAWTAPVRDASEDRTHRSPGSLPDPGDGRARPTRRKATSARFGRMQS